MGTLLMEHGWQASIEKFVAVGTICAYPKLSRVAFNGISLLPVNLYGPGDHDDPETSHVIPALIRKCLDARETGAASWSLLLSSTRRPSRSSPCAGESAPEVLSRGV